YYPFGGTAVWSAKHTSEAKYKYVRYSGKERDATGLYYYGYRYYMPWMGRWLNPDPAWTVDGLNLYQMVRNNPLIYKDSDGRALEWLDLAATEKTQNMAELTYLQLPELREFHHDFTDSTRKILDKTDTNEQRLKLIKKPKDREKESRNIQFTNSKLKGYAAHAGFVNTPQGDSPVYKDGFLNFAGSLKNKNTFPGVKLISDEAIPELEKYHPNKLAKSSRWRPNTSLGYYRVVDIKSFISGVKEQYNKSDNPLHPVVETRIKAHIAINNNVLPKMAGIAGLHAEVQALNYLVSTSDIRGNTTQKLNNSYIFTQRLTGDKNNDFPACHNCSGIISGLEHVMTGKVESDKRLRRRNSI
ncbi:RHS repeat-associated core domain-containing protein, partial [Shewanella sp. YLB-07]|uniref:RHS repeat-associated core domain-containing protein n=1 Tax=Shewanella sp. YLB-07 TaxID=2601268 RepID=UPI002AD215F0